MSATRVLAWPAALALLAAACDGPPPAVPPAVDAGTADRGQARDVVLAPLERWEEAERARLPWRTAAPGQESLGADPIAVVRVAQARWLVALRGLDQLMLVGTAGGDRARLSTVRAPRAFAAGADGTVLVVGELSGEIQRVRAVDDTLVEVSRVRVAGRAAFRDIAAGTDARGAEVLWVVDPIAGTVLTLDTRGTVLGSLPVGPGAFVVRAAGGLVIAAAVDAHRAVVAPVDARGVPDAGRAVELKNDGPIWALEARVVGDEVLIALGLAEDHPLDRTQGSFQFIDSFLRVEALPVGAAWKAGALPAPRRVLLMNLSDRNVVMPKALWFLGDRVLFVAGAGSGRLLAVNLDETLFTDVRAIPPGSASMALLGDGSKLDFVIANPLLDAVVIAREHDEIIVPIAGGLARRPLARIGEALIFTNLIAPRQKSEGGLSRFTCEACHFEGQGDGRIHSTGRGDVHATTKPLFGLGNNVPLFSRALDPSLIRMADNEFRVANAHTDLDPWFSIGLTDAPWLSHLGVRTTLDAPVLRQALASFLLEMRPRTNPRVVGRTAFDDKERAGARLFEQRCARCHAPRLIGNDPKSAVALSAWEALVFSDAGPLVWSRDGYEITGVEPLVHERGARPSSLRRIERKFPYFTNGSAQTLDEVLQRARFDDGGAFLHAGERASLRAFSDVERQALLSFLVLL